MIKNKFKIKNRGFTLVEMLIAVGLFVVVATISMGALLSIYDANRRTQASKTVVDNLNLSIENMARTVRFGKNYFCGSSSYPDDKFNCSTGNNSISVTFQGSRIIYRLNGTAIQRSDDGGSNYTNITSPETVIEYLKFYVFNTDPSPDTGQPYVIAVIKGYSGTKPTTKTIFSIETLMSQRKRDFNI